MPGYSMIAERSLVPPIYNEPLVRKQGVEEPSCAFLYLIMPEGLVLKAEDGQYIKSSLVPRFANTSERITISNGLFRKEGL